MSTTDEQRSETDSLMREFADLERRYRAAVIAEGEAETRALDTEPDRRMRERIALREKAQLTNYITAAIRGRRAAGVEAELQAAAGIGDGIPIELWDAPQRETRADAATGAPGTVGVNLDRIRPQVFANSIASRLGIEMPRVASGTYASATITTALTAGAKAKGGAAESTAAAFTVTTATPKRISARLGVRIEDVAAVGQANFEAILRENLSLVLADELDKQGINGDGQAPNITGILKRLTDPTAPTSVADFDAFVAAFADAVDGLWAGTAKDVGIVCGPATYRLSAKAFRDRVIDTGNRGGESLGDEAFSDYVMRQYGGWWTNKRMPDAASNVQQAILYRKGQPPGDGRARDVRRPLGPRVRFGEGGAGGGSPYGRGDARGPRDDRPRTLQDG